jgi:hypothetical protein
MAPRFPHYRIAGIAMLVASLLAVHCGARQIRNETELEQAVKLAKAGEESGWRSLEKTLLAGEEDQNLDLQKKVLLEVGKIKSERSEIILKASISDKYLRSEAAAGLANQRNEKNRQALDSLIVNSAFANAKEFGGLTRGEIKALGETDDPEAVRALKDQIGKDPNKDEATIDALGKILLRQRQSWLFGLDPQWQLGQAKSSGKGLSLETIDITKSQSATAAPATAVEAPDPEKVLIDYLDSNGAGESKDRAAEKIAAAHKEGNGYLLTLAGKSSLGVTARIAIVDYLTRTAVNAQDKSMINKFYALRRRSNSAKLTASINLSLRILGSAFGRPIGTGYVRRKPVDRDGFDPLRKESDIVSLKQRPYPEYSAADVKTNLRKALKYYHLDPSLADRMQNHVSGLLNLPQNRESAERNLIFVALGRLFPNRDFYVLKKQGQDAFGKPGYFTTTLRLVTASARGRSWQIGALQRVWGLSYAEADKIRQIYLRDGKILQQRMRL